MATKKVKILTIIAAVLLVLAGVLYALKGSMEMFPTDEQEGKNMIVGAIIVLIGVAVGIGGFMIKPKRRSSRK